MKLGEFIRILKEYEEWYSSEAEVIINGWSDFNHEGVLFEEEDEAEIIIEAVSVPSDRDMEKMAKEMS